MADGDVGTPPDAGQPPGAGTPPTPPQPPDVAGSPSFSAMTQAMQGPQVTAPGPGNFADALVKIHGAMEVISGALQALVGTPHFKSVLGALHQLQKVVGQAAGGTAMAGVMQTQAGDMGQAASRNAAAARIAQMMGGQQQSGPGGAPAGPNTPMPTAPLPSTALPGA